MQYLFDELPYLDDPADAGAAIRAISNSSWVRGSALEPEAMQDLREAINDYRDSDQPEIRAAAVAAMRTIATTQYLQKLLQSFDDSSAFVRQAAMQLYINNPFKSSDLENKLFKNL
ncbi:MAG: HEAT repeat protein [Arenicella sp.]